jgi:hypothetical protein
MNEALVWTVVNRKARDLKNDSDPFFSTPLHLLASSQAMILYQIIRLFDGDIHQRANAETDETILMSWIEQLPGVYQFLKFGADYVSGIVNKLSFTAQSALWKARTQYHWQRAAQERPHFGVLIANWDVDTAGVKPEDLDELGVLIMATYKGMEFMYEWLGTENAAQYGL